MKDTPLFYWTTLLFTVTVKLRKSLEESGHPCLRASYKVDVKVTLWKNYFKHMGLNSDHWVCKTELITTRQKSQSYHTSHLYYQVKFPMKLLLKRQHHSSKASILRHSAFFIVQLSYLYTTTGKTIALTIQTFVSKVISLFFLICSLGWS